MRHIDISLRQVYDQSYPGADHEARYSGVFCIHEVIPTAIRFISPEIRKHLGPDYRVPFTITYPSGMLRTLKRIATDVARNFNESTG